MLNALYTHMNLVMVIGVPFSSEESEAYRGHIDEDFLKFPLKWPLFTQEMQQG